MQEDLIFNITKRSHLFVGPPLSIWFQFGIISSKTIDWFASRYTQEKLTSDEWASFCELLRFLCIIYCASEGQWWPWGTKHIITYWIYKRTNAHTHWGRDDWHICHSVNLLSQTTTTNWSNRIINHYEIIIIIRKIRQKAQFSQISRMHRKNTDTQEVFGRSWRWNTKTYLMKGWMIKVID